VDQKAEREREVTATKLRSAETHAKHSTAIGFCYDLSRKLLEDEPQAQWDRIVTEVHNKDPWMGLDGKRDKGLHMKTSELLEDCIMIRKLTVFNCNAAERQKAYMMGSNPHHMTIQKHVSHCEMMSGYIAYLPMLQDSHFTVASTKKGNIPFNKATLVNIVLATCPTELRKLYKMNHKTVPELKRSMLFDLENIEKVFAEKDCKKARSNKAAAGTAPKKG
jgi:hypothetical protein